MGRLRGGDGILRTLARALAASYMIEMIRNFESDLPEGIIQRSQWRGADAIAWRHQWRVGDLVLWDNRATMHRRDPFSADQRRVMHRTQVKGEAPPAA